MKVLALLVLSACLCSAQLSFDFDAVDISQDGLANSQELDFVNSEWPSAQEVAVESGPLEDFGAAANVSSAQSMRWLVGEVPQSINLRNLFSQSAKNMLWSVGASTAEVDKILRNTDHMTEDFFELALTRIYKGPFTRAIDNKLYKKGIYQHREFFEIVVGCKPGSYCATGDNSITKPLCNPGHENPRNRQTDAFCGCVGGTPTGLCGPIPPTPPPPPPPPQDCTTVDLCDQFYEPLLCSQPCPDSLSTGLLETSYDFSSDNCLGTIDTWIGCLDGVTELIFDDNQLTGSIPFQLADITTLEHFSVRNNDLESVSSAIGDLEELTYLDLSDNAINVENLWDFSSQTRLAYLNLSANLFYGSVPDSFYDIEKDSPSTLITLDLSYNSLDGTFPKGDIGRFTTLEILKVNDNDFNGPFPDELGLATRLVVLNMGNNPDYEGTIPWRGAFDEQLQNLEILDLQNMDLDGEIPKGVFKSLTSIEEIYLNDNKFEDDIPDDIADGDNLVKLWLFNNAFGADNEGMGNSPKFDTMPNSICNTFAIPDPIPAPANPDLIICKTNEKVCYRGQCNTKSVDEDTDTIGGCSFCER